MIVGFNYKENRLDNKANFDLTIEHSSLLFQPLPFCYLLQSVFIVVSLLILIDFFSFLIGKIPVLPNYEWEIISLSLLFIRKHCSVVNIHRH